ncbi:MAG: TRAP transporter substrate-binding protein [Paraglaciecola sp.]|uniref:TRAP transporter substrate-binding protein n=1 Tax=Paraglaciecola sp. TaxID=1920173 RepID=UPI00326600B9
MNKPKSGIFLLTALFITALASGLALVTASQEEGQITLRLPHSLDPEHVVHKSLLHFKQQVEALSNNQINIQIYTNGQLGSERDQIELLQVGSLAMTKVSISSMEAFVPEMQVFNLPYVFRDKTHYWQTLESELGAELLDAPIDVGLKGLAYFDAGSRSFYTCNRAVQHPDDLSGLKIRTMKSQSAVKMTSAMGASATPISFGELYTALQQGVVDGAENNAITLYKSRHYEICKNYTLDEHNSIPDIIIISQLVWQGLTPQQQSWINQAMQSAVSYQRALWKKDTELALEALRAEGVNIITPDKAPFMQRVSAFKSSFNGTEVGDLLERIEQL